MQYSAKSIEIVNLSKEKPSQPWDVIVDRGTPLGNPFHMSSELQRDRVCREYEEYLYDVLTGDGHGPRSITIRREVRNLVNLFLQHGKLRLFCWCHPKRCHAEALKSHVLGILMQPINLKVLSDGTFTLRP